MSSMLGQAIIDVEELKRIAKEKAEQDIIEQYSSKVKNVMEELLQKSLLNEDETPFEDEDLGGMDDLGGMNDMSGEAGGDAGGPIEFGDGGDGEVGGKKIGASDDGDSTPSLPLAALDGETIGSTTFPSEDEMIEIDLDNIGEEEFGTSENEFGQKSPWGHDNDDSGEGENGGSFLNESADGVTEDRIFDPNNKEEDKEEDKEEEDKEEDKEEEDKEEVQEEGVEVDYQNVKTPHAPFGSNNEEDEINLMLSQLCDEAEELENKNKTIKKESRVKSQKLAETMKTNDNLRKDIKKLVEAMKMVNKELVTITNNYEKSNKTVKSLKANFNMLQSESKKLFFKNQVLEDRTLNARQRKQIVEAIERAKSGEEAKIVYETLQSTVEGRRVRSEPKSLSEAMDKRASPLLSIKSRQQPLEPPKTNHRNTRWKELAGI